MSFKTFLFSTAFATVIAGGAASAFEVTPITKDFDPSGRGANQSFQLTNDRDEQVTVSVSVATRQVDADGKEIHNPTTDFTVFPTEVVLPPRGAQVVRARWNGAPTRRPNSPTASLPKKRRSNSAATHLVRRSI